MKENNLKKLSVNITSIAPQALDNYSKKPDKKRDLMKLPKLKIVYCLFYHQIYEYYTKKILSNLVLTMKIN